MKKYGYNSELIFFHKILLNIVDNLLTTKTHWLSILNASYQPSVENLYFVEIHQQPTFVLSFLQLLYHWCLAQKILGLNYEQTITNKFDYNQKILARTSFHTFRKQQLIFFNKKLIQYARIRSRYWGVPFWVLSYGFWVETRQLKTQNP